MLSLIVCYSKNRVIGKNGKMPWYVSDDLKRFKGITMGHTLVMGRKTYEAIGHPLEGRTIVVVSNSCKFEGECVVTVNSLDLGLKWDKDVIVCGGADVYSQVMDKVEVMYITELKQNYEGDTYFPEFDASLFNIEIEKETDEYRFITYRRKYD